MVVLVVLVGGHTHLVVVTSQPADSRFCKAPSCQAAMSSRATRIVARIALAMSMVSILFMLTAGAQGT